MSEHMRVGLIGVSDGHELEAVLSAEGIELAGYWGEDKATLSALADYHGLPAADDWRALLGADALYLGAGLSDPAAMAATAELAARPVLLAPALLARAGAPGWLTALAARSALTGVALPAANDDALAQARQLVRAGVLGPLLGVEVRASSAESGEAAWALLAEQLGAALWTAGLEVVSLAALTASGAGARYITALATTTAGAPLTISWQAATPGGAHDALLAPRLLGERGQLILTAEPLLWMVDAPEGSQARRWERMVYAGQRGSLARCLTAFGAALQAGRTLPLSLAEALPLARLLAALRGANATGAWRAL